MTLESLGIFFVASVGESIANQADFKRKMIFYCNLITSSLSKNHKYIFGCGKKIFLYIFSSSGFLRKILLLTKIELYFADFVIFQQL